MWCKFVLMSGAAGFVLILSLTACQPSHLVSVQPDPWNPPQAQLRLAGSNSQLAAVGDGRALRLADQVSFAGTQANGIKDVWVQSRCVAHNADDGYKWLKISEPVSQSSHQPSGKSASTLKDPQYSKDLPDKAQRLKTQQTLQLGERLTYPLQDLMPIAILAHSHKNWIATCDFKFTLMNLIGSTRTRWVRDLQIQRDPMTSALPILVNNEPLDSSPSLPVVREHELESSLRAPTLPAQSGSLTLACERFHVTLRGTLNQINLSTLARTPLAPSANSPDNDAPDSGASHYHQISATNPRAPDPRKADTQQICRLIERDPSGQTKISDEFQIRFPTPKLDYTFHLLPMNDYKNIQRDPIHIFELDLTNPHDFQVTIALPMDPGASFAFQGAIAKQTLIYSSIYLRPIRYAIKGGDDLPSKSGHDFATVAAHSTLAVIGYVPTMVPIPDGYCSTSNFCEVFWGLRYEFRPGIDFRFLQTAKPVSAQNGKSAVFVKSTTFFNPIRNFSPGPLEMAAPYHPASH